MSCCPAYLSVHLSVSTLGGSSPSAGARLMYGLCSGLFHLSFCLHRGREDLSSPSPTLKKSGSLEPGHSWGKASAACPVTCPAPCRSKWPPSSLGKDGPQSHQGERFGGLWQKGLSTDPLLHGALCSFCRGGMWRFTPSMLGQGSSSSWGNQQVLLLLGTSAGSCLDHSPTSVGPGLSLVLNSRLPCPLSRQ